MQKNLADRILIASAWVDFRHRRTFNSDTLQVALLGDPVRTQEAKLAWVDGFHAKSRCCVPWGIRPWYDKSREELLSVKMAIICWRWAGLFMNGIADLECRHARNKREAGDNISFETLAANYVNSEAKAVTTMSTRRRI